MLEVIRSYIVDFTYALRTICAFGLLFLMIKAVITKSRLDKMKRNVFFIKYFVINLYGLALFVSFIIFKTWYADYFYRNVTVIVAMTIYIALILLYSGTPLIFFQKEVKYSWPIKPDWNDDWMIKHGNLIIIIWFLIVLYCDLSGYI